MASIQGIYLALFGRPADPSGLAYYNGVTNNGGDLSGIGNLAGQKEYLDRFSGMSSTQIVQSIYQSLFGRAGEQAGVDFWVGRLTSGALSINNIAIAILDGATGTDKQTVDAKIAAADLFTSHLDLPAEQKAYDASTVGRARDYIATIDASHPGTASAVDALIAQNQTSAGQGPADGGGAGGGDNGDGSTPPVKPVSLTVLDADHVSPLSADPVTQTTAADDTIKVSDPYHAVGTIDGGAGRDTLVVTTGGNVAPGAGHISNIETLKIASSTDGGTIDLSNVQGLQEIWRQADTHAVNIAGIGKSVTTLGMEGSFTADAAYDLADSSGANDAITLVLKNANTNNSEVFVNGFEKITINVDGASQIAIQGNSLETLAVTGEGDLNLYYYENIFQPTSRARVVDASQHEGSTHLGLREMDGSLTFIGGTGNDYIDVTGTNQTLTGGGGVNTFSIASGGGVAGMNVITDFNPLVDYLVVNDFTEKVRFSTDLKTLDRATIAQSASLNDALAYVGSLTQKDGAILGSTIVFAYENDTYVYTDRGADGLSASDGILKITGVSSAIDPYHFVVVIFGA